MSRALSVQEHVDGVLAGDRSVIARTITLVESTAAASRPTAEAVLAALLPHTGQAHRIGVTGVPGAGKSTFVETLGSRLLDQGHRVAVLAIDPTSQRSGGSILGDKTRMPTLASHEHAFVRPSPTGGTLGGGHRATREAIRVLEAAGYDLVFVETVGVGQSEIAVADMVDTFLVLLLAGAGDDLQGIKRGILEVADVLAIHKADGDNVLPAQRARLQLESALHVLPRRYPGWDPPVLTCSSVTGEGIDTVWDRVVAHRAHLAADGTLDDVRAGQRLRWMWALANDTVLSDFHGAVDDDAGAMEAAVRGDTLSPAEAARRLVEAWRRT